MGIEPSEVSQKNRYDWTISNLESLILEKKIRVVYDIGGRDAIMKARIESLGVEYYGFDLFPLDESMKEWNIEKPFPYKEFPKPDVIIMLEVLEHLQNPWKGIENISNLLSTGCYFILTTPNPHWSRSRIDFLLKNFLTCFTVSDLEKNHHVFTPWPHIVERLLSDNKLGIYKYTCLDGKTKLFGKPIRFNFFIKFFFRLLQKLIESEDKKSVGMSYGIISKKP